MKQGIFSRFRANIFAVTVISFLLGTSIFSQSNLWQKQSVKPTGIDLNNLFFLSANEGWAVGYSGLIIHTADGGQSWEVQRVADPSEVLTSVFFKDSLHGWTGGGNMLYTVDGGRTWQQGLCDGNPCFNTVLWEFLDNTRGFATIFNSGEAAILKTTDGGRNWTKQTVPTQVSVIKFFDGQNGIAFNDRILRTSDGGVTWTLQPGSTRTGLTSYGGAFFIDFNRAWRINNSDFVGGLIRQTIDYTVDGGINWTRVAPPDGTFIFNLHFIDANNGWGVGSRENIIRTTDGGLTWQTQKGGRFSGIENYYPLNKITFTDNLHGTAIGGGGIIYTTSDGGGTWTPRQTGTKTRAVRIFALNERFAWVGHESGQLTYTTDGGKFWHRTQVTIPSAPADAVTGLAFLNEREGWAATKGAGTIFHTTDGGGFWELAPGAPMFPAFSLDAVGRTIVSVGFDGGGAPIVRSNDGGQTWTRFAFPGTSTLRDVDMVTENIGYIAGSGWLLKTINGGATWQTLRTGPSWVSISFADTENGWSVAVNTNGFKEIWHTSNGGQTWDITPGDNVVSVHAVSAQTAWVATANYNNFTSTALRTTDGGQTYTEEAVASNTILDDIFFVDAENGWVGGTNTNFTSNASNAGGAIYRRGRRGLVNTAQSIFDFDGDGKSDISIFRPTAGEWWYSKSSNGGNAAFRFGSFTDKIAPADFTGDGKTDAAFFRPSTGEWFVLRSEDASYYSFTFGTPGDIPTPADYDGDGKTDAAVFRPSNSTWYVNKSTGGVTIRQFGIDGDVPVVSDYDGDGNADIAIYRPSAGEWWIQRSTNGLIAFQFGNSTDKPVQGDYTGDGKADAAFRRPATGEWFVLRSENQSYYSFPFGTSADTPAPADYDGDGKTDAAVFRPANNTWYVQRTNNGSLIQTFGQNGDVPVPNAFVP